MWDAHVDEAGMLVAALPVHISGCPLGDDGGVGIIAGILHIERIEDILADELLVGAAGYLLDQVAEQYVARVAVAPLRARLEIEGLVAETRHQLVGRGGKRLELPVIRKAGEARDARR